MRDGKFLICTLIPNTDGIKSDKNSQARVKKGCIFPLLSFNFSAGKFIKNKRPLGRFITF